MKSDLTEFREEKGKGTNKQRYSLDCLSFLFHWFVLRSINDRASVTIETSTTGTNIVQRRSALSNLIDGKNEGRRSFSFISFVFSLQSLNETEDYDLYLNEAQRIVELVLNQSIDHVRETIEESQGTNQSTQIRSEDDYWKNKTHSTVQWPTIEQFTDDKIGLNKIVEYIENVGEEQPKEFDRSIVSRI